MKFSHSLQYTLPFTILLLSLIFVTTTFGIAIPHLNTNNGINPIDASPEDKAHSPRAFTNIINTSNYPDPKLSRVAGAASAPSCVRVATASEGIIEAGLELVEREETKQGYEPRHCL
jgi:hypothetical protein